MIFIPIVILAIIQGITEFLPISSSGHLVLAHAFVNDGLNDVDQKRLDIAVHIGTLIAVLLYFRADVIEMAYGALDILRGRFKTPNAQQTWVIGVASIPVILAGFTLYCFDMTAFDSLYIIGWTTLVFGVLLYIADKRPQNDTPIESFTTKTAIIYGLFQVIALIPGVSRSGVTMTAGRFLGHSRTNSARMSLLMGMVTIAAAGLLTGVDVFQDSTISNDFLITMCIGITLSFTTAYAAIWVMMRWFAQKGTMTPFVIYRVLLGVALLGLLYGGVIAKDMQF